VRGSWTPPSVAADQFGVFSAEQALAAGYSHYQIRRLLRDGRWSTVVGSVYTASASTLGAAALARAAQLAVQCDAVVSHLTGAALRGLVVPFDPDLHLIVPLDSRVRIRGVRTHRVPIDDDDVDVVDGILTTGIVRTVVDSILWLPEDHGRALVIDALQRRLIDVDDLRSGLASVGRRHGIGRARSILEAVGGVPHSEMEARVHRLLRDAGIGGWTANTAVHDADGLVGYVDLVFERQLVAVELDGHAYHSDPARFQRDRERQNRLVALGYVVLRFAWDDVVHRSASLLTQVRGALARAAA